METSDGTRKLRQEQLVAEDPVKEITIPPYSSRGRKKSNDTADTAVFGSCSSFSSTNARGVTVNYHTSVLCCVTAQERPELVRPASGTSKQIAVSRSRVLSFVRCVTCVPRCALVLLLKTVQIKNGYQSDVLQHCSSSEQLVTRESRIPFAVVVFLSHER